MNDYHFENLVFEGGGVKGIAYVGALGVLKEKSILQNIKRFGGTSAGAITALLLALEYTTEEIGDILGTLDFKNFLDSSWGLVRNTKRLISEFGWYKGDFFYDWIGDKIERKLGRPSATFNALRVVGKPHLYICGTNLSTGFTEVFSPVHTPRMRIADAVRISMSIPLFFRSVINGARGDNFVDGGVQRNYPIKLFDRLKYIDDENRGQINHGYDRKTEYYDRENARFLAKHPNSSPYVYNKATLGFRLEEREKIVMFRDGAAAPTRKITDFFDYCGALFRAFMKIQANRHLHGDDWQRTIYIDTLGVKTTDFDISDAKKLALVQSGRQYTEEYFEWFDDLDNDPAINHPENTSHTYHK